jgi:NADH-quinone oxidoreductase subunit N
MNAPIIWIVLPGITSIVLWYFRKDERRALLIGLFASLFFILTSAFIQVGKPLIQIGSFTLQISPSITILGRSFTLGNGDLVFTSLLFLILFLFLSMSFVIDVPPIFVPISFLLVSLFLAALSVQPFLYAALLLEICVILSVVLLSSNGKTPGTGVMRFLIFQTLAMPFILASGWVLSAVEANPTEIKLIIQALILLGLGFSFWLGVFPFNSWMSQVAEENSPFLVGFVLLLFNTATLILVIRYLDGFVWLRDNKQIFIVLKVMGMLMTITSAIMLLWEKQVFRTIAYLVSFETGMALLAMSLNRTEGWYAFVLMFLPRILAISLWVVSITYIHQQQINHPGQSDLHTIILTGTVCAIFTIAGLPILPEFVPRVSIFALFSIGDPVSTVWIAVANVIFIAGCLRFILRLMNTNRFSLQSVLSKIELGYFLALNSLLVFLGIAPQVIVKSILNMLQAFQNIK